MSGTRRGEAANPPRTADLLASPLEELARTASATARELAAAAGCYADWALETLEAGGKLLFCGNGGSASTVQHVAAEYVVRFRRLRRALPALALADSMAALTAAANDFDYDSVFERPLRALGRPGDLLVAHSTSGGSANVLRAVEVAREVGLRTVGLTGSPGGELAERVDLALRVPSEATARVQEVQLAIEHAVVEYIEEVFAGREGEGAG